MIRAKKFELNFDIGISLADDIDRSKKRFCKSCHDPLYVSSQMVFLLVFLQEQQLEWLCRCKEMVDK